MEANIQNWDFNYTNDDNRDNYTTLLIEYSNSNNIEYLLDKTKTEYSLIEKTVYDISNFHLNRLNIDINSEDIYISFWFKYLSQKCPKCTNLHMDRDDYEDRILNTTTNRPFLSVITYLTDNNNPTIITSIDDSVKEKKNYMDNPSICFSFPKKYKQISFTGGKYLHGETQIFENDYINKDNQRSLLIIKFNKKIPPLNVPLYNEPILFYHAFLINNTKLNNTTYCKTDDILTINQSNDPPLYVMVDDSIINYNFFQNIIEERKFDSFNNFPKIFKYILTNSTKRADQLIIDIVSNSHKYNPKDIIYYSENKKLTQNTIHNSYTDTESIMSDDLKFKLNTWTINSDSDGCILSECLANIDNSSDIFHKSFILNHSKPSFDLIEKSVYDIADFHLRRMNTDFVTNVTIEFSFSSNMNTIHIEGDNHSNKEKRISKKPLLTTMTYITDSNSPLLITNIDEDAYKFKNLEDKNMCIFFPKRMKHVSFDGGKYYHHKNIFNMDNIGRVLYINLWVDYCPKNIPYYNKKWCNNIDEFAKDTNLIHFTNKNENIKKISSNIDVFNDNFFEKMLYKRNADVFYHVGTVLEREELDIYDTFILHANTSDNLVDNSSIDKTTISNGNASFQKKITGLNEHFIEKEIIPNEMSKWMAHEIEIHLSKYHCNQIDTNNVVNVDSIPKLLKYIVKNLFDTISQKIRTKMILSANATFNFNNIFIIKYSEMYKYIQLNSTLTLYLFLGDSVHFFIGDNNQNFVNDDFTVMKSGDIFVITPRCEKTNIKNINGDGYIIVFDIDVTDDI